jgi:hypothetical protein
MMADGTIRRKAGMLLVHEPNRPVNVNIPVDKSAIHDKIVILSGNISGR